MNRSARAIAVTRGTDSRYNDEVTTDAMLVRAALAGDTTAFAALVERHARACIRYATRMLGNEQDAEDAAQETFIRAYGALARFDGSVAFRTWLMTILINRCRTALAVRRRFDDRATELHDATLHAGVAGAENQIALRHAIDRALGRIDPQQREAFLLKHVEELSYDEMVVVTGAGVSALKMRVRRACEHLRELLEEDRRG
jgi:RNA polymerase sigma-70 factor (ECF subfamily)